MKTLHTYPADTRVGHTALAGTTREPADACCAALRRRCAVPVCAEAVGKAGGRLRQIYEGGAEPERHQRALGRGAQQEEAGLLLLPTGAAAAGGAE